MLRTTVLFLLLSLAAIQAKDDLDCETAKESLQRSFDVLSISTRELGRQCREEKRECDKKMREFAKLQDDFDTCEIDKSNMGNEIVNYAASIDEISSALYRCNMKLEEEETVTQNSDILEFEENTTRENEALTAALESARHEASELQQKLENEIASKDGLLEQINALNESKTNLEALLQGEKESKENLQVQLDAEKASVDAMRKELHSLKEEKMQLQQLSADYIANYTDTRTEINELKIHVAKLEKENKNVLKKLAICNELRAQAIDDATDANNQQNEIEINKNGTEKCGRIGRGLDLTRTPSGVYYFNHKTALPWVSANDFCRSRGLDLASAETEEEILEVGRVRSLGYHIAFWTAASDRGHPAGQFHWPSGRKVASSLWFPGQPDQASQGREDCAYVYGSKLKDSPCSASFYFACQVPRECIPHLN
ncbi:C-type lectin domain family 4 member K-like [Cloeon dipterum]|uniref:C-type lectin domain family 4 member K-like n=1 Tax=Cloeon dipterum TaxID=197152 RepID=UPI00321F8C46